MNEEIAILVFVAAVGLTFWGCAMLRHGTCDMGKLFTLIVTVVGAVTGVYLFVHAFAFVKVSKEDAVWGGIAGFILMLYSFQQIWLMFKELYAAKVEPLHDKSVDPAIGEASRKDAASSP